MSDSDVAELLRIAPFNQIDPSSFPPTTSLAGILKHDCRLLDLKEGDLLVREGDYGSSAFLILFGEALVSLTPLPAALLGRKSSKPKGWGKAIAQLWQNSRFPETRDDSATTTASAEQPRTNSVPQYFLHDIPRVVRQGETVALKAGEFFGEISALTRSPRSATVIANSKMRVLEIRWQGFRELLKRHPALNDRIQQLYRENSLRAHLRETPLFKSLSVEAIQQLADEVIFASYGNFEWNREFKSTSRKDVSEKILAEPVIVAEGDYVNGLILIRSGFARLSRQHGDGHQTIAYLGKGQVVGLRELVHNWQTGAQHPWLLSLRAVGYVDVLKIPTLAVEQLVLPELSPDQIPAPIKSSESFTQPVENRRQAPRAETVEAGLMEFLVEKRLINGTRAMLIDLDRCTRCDDCVRACASTHDNNPRFNRTGEKYDHWMIANACMHCLDPVCMIGCPTGAIGREQNDGIVVINDQTCIGCSACANSCPYGNIKMVEINDPQGNAIVDERSGLPIAQATKCDFCIDQLGGPACQRACPHEALVRIDLTTTEQITQWSQH